MPEQTPPTTLAIDASLGELAAVRAFVRQHVAAAGGDEITMADLVQAVDELVCNVIQHGYAGRPGRVEIAALSRGDELAFRIRDDAPAFDPRSVPEPPLDLPLDRRPLGGMGIHLARALTDGLDHRILPTGGNEVTVRKRLRSATEGSGNGHHDRPTEH
jgi:anti-sigma regulatory factor (Ser/Thr protein kinase)